MQTPKKHVVFMGGKTLGLECLRYLVDRREDLGIEISAVMTSPRGEAIEEFSRNHGLRRISSLEHYLELDDFDVLVSVQYHKILKRNHIEKAKQVAINLHMAPLPEYRGCNQFSYAIINGDREFGTTIHRLEEGVDSGDIIAESRFPIPKDCWVGDLFDLTSRQSIALFRREIKNIIDGNIRLVRQETLIDERGTSFHLRKEIEALKKIDLTWDKDRIERHVRATFMEGFEPPFAVIDGRKVHFQVASSEVEV